MGGKLRAAPDGKRHLQGKLQGSYRRANDHLQPARTAGYVPATVESTKGVLMPLAVTNVEFSIFLHITAVVVGFGATFSESVMFPVAMKMSARNLPYVHRLQLVLNQFFAIPAALVVAATGVYQVDKFNFDYGNFWLSATIAILVIVFLVNILFFIPTDRKLLPIIEKAIADAGDRELKLSDLPPTYQRLGRAEGIVGSIMGILLIAAIFFMTTKPGLG
jgi:uncharacterized membrane protein